MSGWIQGHLWQTTVFIVLYLLLTVLWQLIKRFWRRRHARRLGGRSGS